MNTRRIWLTDAQRSALECRDGGGLDPAIVTAWDPGRHFLTVSPETRDELYTAVNDASNAEDAAHQGMETDPELRKLAGRAARSLCALAGRILREA